MEINTNEPLVQEKQNSKMLSGLFANNGDAEKGYQYLIENGYVKNDISVIMSEATQATYYPQPVAAADEKAESIQGAETGTAIGSSIGVTMGAIVGIALAIGSNVIVPGLGFLIAGPILAGLVGAGAGGITGGLIGPLIGVGYGEDTAKNYETKIKAGNILISLHPAINDTDSITKAWQLIGAIDIHQ